MLTLDIDFGDVCSLNCPHCFRRDNAIDKRDDRKQLEANDLKEVIIQSKELGLKSIKFLGKGELLENKDLIDFLLFLKDNDITPILFTKGHVIVMIRKSASTTKTLRVGVNSFKNYVNAMFLYFWVITLYYHVFKMQWSVVIQHLDLIFVRNEIRLYVS
ncbi:hypothetical protein FACS189443_6270 [Planctomycetales bacterium]|nr:hypothetical protein FACS189443_6270 [Planctomycetales bacterium]